MWVQNIIFINSTGQGIRSSHVDFVKINSLIYEYYCWNYKKEIYT
jgi:hypothetical protein